MATPELAASAESQTPLNAERCAVRSLEEAPLRILTLCYEWPPVGGGGGRAAEAIAEALASRGHKVRVQTIRFNETPAHQVVANVDVYRTWGFRQRADQCTPLEMAGYIASSTIPTLRHIAEFRPDLIHAHFAVPTGALALATSFVARLPYLITVHLGDVPGAIPEQTDMLFRRLNSLIRPIWRRAAAVVSVSKFGGELAQKAYGREPIVIPNGISLSRRPGVPQPATRAPRLIFVGRLNSQKNLHSLPPILAKLRQFTWELDMVGDGEERASLETAFAEIELADRVHFHGWLDRPVVEAKMRAAEIFIFPSFVEGLSLAVLEALKFGLLLVTSDIPTLRECVASGLNGYLISLDAPDQWVEKLRSLLSDPELRLAMRRKSWEMVERFDLERIADQYETLLRRIAAENPRRNPSIKAP